MTSLLLGRLSPLSRRLLNIFLCLSQTGMNAVYILFLAQNLRQVVESHFAPGWDYRVYIGLLLLPVIMICSIRELKILSPLILLASVLEFSGMGIIFYLILSTPLPSITSVPSFSSLRKLPLFFGTIFFAFDGINKTLPVENQMRNPEVTSFYLRRRRYG